MKFTAQLVLSLVLLTSAVSLQLALAAETANPYSRPAGRAAAGPMKIDRIDIKEGEIVVNDRLFKLSPNLRVYSANGMLVPPSSLRKGMGIMFNDAKGNLSYPAVSEIRITAAK